MRRPASPVPALLLVLLAACLLAPASAAAHELVVLPVGAGEIDAGLADPARLIHATLDKPGDTLVVTVRSSGAPLELLLLMPDRRPESKLDGEALPQLEWAAAPGQSVIEGEPRRELVDEATAVEYGVLSSETLALEEGAPVTVTIRRGTQPARVALRVGAATSFEAADVERTPRTLVKLRAWVETPAPSAEVDRTPVKTTSRPVVAIYGAGVALLGVLIAAWWVWSGRRRSRERGAERAAEERGS